MACTSLITPLCLNHQLLVLPSLLSTLLQVLGLLVSILIVIMMTVLILHLVVKLFKVSLHCIKYGTIDWAILTMRFSELFSIFVNKVCLIKLYDFVHLAIWVKHIDCPLFPQLLLILNPLNSFFVICGDLLL